MKRCLLIINPSSGQRTIQNSLDKLAGQLILQQFKQCQGHTFHELAVELLALELDKDYQDYLQKISELDGQISPQEFIEFFQMTFPKSKQTLEKRQD